MDLTDRLIQNYHQIRRGIDRSCVRAGRCVQEVELMAVTKYAPDEAVLALLQTGLIGHIGESRVQQAVRRWTQPAFACYPVKKHFIGHLQKNKVAPAAKLFDFIDSIDDICTARLLNDQAKALGKVMFALVQIKLTDRDSQSGVSLAQAPQLVRDMQHLEFVRPCGYMAIAPQTDTPSLLRPLFQQVKQAFDRDFPATLPQRYLSLGMSADFETAVEEGSTLPRVGSKLFAVHLEEL